MSQVPLLVKTGVSIWKARRVPVGSRLAKVAVLVRVWDSARRDRDGACGCGCGDPADADADAAVASAWDEVVAASDPDADADVDGCLVVVVGLCLTDDIIYSLFFDLSFSK